MSYKLNDIVTLNDQDNESIQAYVKCGAWCSQNKYILKSIGNNQFQIVDPMTTIPKEDIAKIKRVDRDKLLADTDYLFNPNYPLNEMFTEQEIQEIKEYRQALRDITEQKKFPYIKMPDLPQCLKK